jgi:NAD(P)-dependent dehydrogenase (short-subunit alcohol dehydrogenase family)
MLGLEGKSILVTGASGGIGAATVRQLAAAGAKVYAGARKLSSLDALVAETGATPLAFDVLEEDAIAAAVDGLELYGLVNSAGWGATVVPPWEVDQEVFDRVYGINARGTALMVKHVSKYMMEAKAGSIVNISSQASLVALYGHSAYAASKGAVDALTRVAALELGEHGIRVNSVHPTVVMTEMSAFYWGRPEIGGPLLERMPLGRFATEEDIAGPIVFLLSDLASMVNGVALPIDGGYTIA